MPQFNPQETIVLSSGGGTVNIDPFGLNKIYNVTEGNTLTSSWTIQVDPSQDPISGTVFTVYYNAQPVLNGNTLTIFGVPFDDTMALQSWKIDSVWFRHPDTGDLDQTVYISQAITAVNGTILYHYQSGKILRAAIEQLNNTPILLIPAVEPSNMIKVVDAVATIESVTAYTQGIDLWLISQFATQPQMKLSNALANTAATIVAGFVPYNILANGGNQLQPSSGIELTAPGYNPTGGNASYMYIDIIYRIIPLRD